MTNSPRSATTFTIIAISIGVLLLAKQNDEADGDTHTPKPVPQVNDQLEGSAGYPAITPTSVSEAPEPKTTGVASSSTINWTTDLRKAYRNSAKSGKPILLHIVGPNCPPCERQKANTFTNAEVITLTQSFECVLWDISKVKIPASWKIHDIPVDFAITMNGDKPKLLARLNRAPVTASGYISRLKYFLTLAKRSK